MYLSDEPFKKRLLITVIACIVIAISNYAKDVHKRRIKNCMQHLIIKYVYFYETACHTVHSFIFCHEYFSSIFILSFDL